MPRNRSAVSAREWRIPLPVVTRSQLAVVRRREGMTAVEVVQEAVDLYVAMRTEMGERAWTRLVRKAHENGLSTGALVGRIALLALEARP